MNKITIKCHFTNRRPIGITNEIIPFSCPWFSSWHRLYTIITRDIIRLSNLPICKDKIATSGILKCTLDIYYLINTKPKSIISYSISIVCN